MDNSTSPATTTAGALKDGDEEQEPIIGLGIAFIIVALAFTTLLLFGALANCLRKRMKGQRSEQRLEIKSSARRHGPSAFVKDADFAYIDIESRSNSRKKKERQLERYRSLERYHSVKVDAEGSELHASESKKDGKEGMNIEGAVMVEDSSTSSHTSSRRSSPMQEDFDVQITGTESPRASTERRNSLNESPPSPGSVNLALSEVSQSQKTPEKERSASLDQLKQSPPPDLLDQVKGHDLKASSTALSAHGSTTVIYVVGDDYKSSVRSLSSPPSSKQTAPTEQELESTRMPGYIEDEIEGGEFEDPRMYISYL